MKRPASTLSLVVALALYFIVTGDLALAAQDPLTQRQQEMNRLLRQQRLDQLERDQRQDNVQRRQKLNQLQEQLDQLRHQQLN